MHEPQGWGIGGGGGGDGDGGAAAQPDDRLRRFRRAGDKVRLDVLREGKRLSMTVTLCDRVLGICEE